MDLEPVDRKRINFLPLRKLDGNDGTTIDHIMHYFKIANNWQT